MKLQQGQPGRRASKPHKTRLLAQHHNPPPRIPFLQITKLSDPMFRPHVCLGDDADSGACHAKPGTVGGVPTHVILRILVPHSPHLAIYYSLLPELQPSTRRLTSPKAYRAHW
ncbi:hypothetical protein PMIN03_005140 [Paraphaeosphaeria minitans]